jgi:hypothetical protein
MDAPPRSAGSREVAFLLTFVTVSGIELDESRSVKDAFGRGYS